MSDNEKPLKDAVGLICIMDKSPTRYIKCRLKDTPEGQAIKRALNKQAGLFTKPSPNE